MNAHRNKNRSARFLARSKGVKGLLAAPALLFAAGMFSAGVPAANAADAALDTSVTSGDYSADNLSVAAGTIEFGGDAFAEISGTTTLASGSQFTISSSGTLLDFGDVRFASAATASDSITVSASDVVFSSVLATSEGRLYVSEGADLLVSGGLSLAQATVIGTLSVSSDSMRTTMVDIYKGNVSHFVLEGASAMIVLGMDCTVESITFNGRGQVWGEIAPVRPDTGLSRDITVTGDVRGTVRTLFAEETLTLAGNVEFDADPISTFGRLQANRILVTGTAKFRSSDIDNTNAGYRVQSANALEIAEGGSVDLTLDTDVSTLPEITVDGSLRFSSADAIAFDFVSGGSGTMTKSGAGTLSIAATPFAGTLRIEEGDSVLASPFGGNVSVAAGTFTVQDGASIAGTFSAARGTTTEIGDRVSASRLSVGGISEAPAAPSASTVAFFASASSSGTAKIVHDVYSLDSLDVIEVTGTGADLCFATAVVRTDLSVVVDGDVSVALVEGDGVAFGYGALEVEGPGFVYANASLSSDGRSVVFSPNFRAAAAGLGGALFNANQRAVAGALVSLPGETDFTRALSGLTSRETAAALDDLGALHLTSMMPAQIQGVRNHQRSVMNAVGTGTALGRSSAGVWVQYVGSYDDVSSDFDRIGWERRMNGVTAGIERAFSDDLLAGFALGYEHSNLNGAGNKVRDDAVSADFYVRHRKEKFEQRAALSFVAHDYETTRSLA